MASLSRRRDRGADYWPGFVDALSTLLLCIIFVLAIFVLGQFLLNQEVNSRDTVLQRLNRQVLDLTDLLALERTGRRSAEDGAGLASATLEALQVERTRLQGIAEAVGASRAQAEGQASSLTAALSQEKTLSERAVSQVEVLNQQLAALRRQLAAVEEALSATEAKERDSQTRVAELGARLNVALAQRVQELTRYRSEFFGRLRQILGQRPDIRIVGDRFVFQSELFFDPGLAALKPEAFGEIDKLATVIQGIDREIPSDVPWIIRVDGHTDARPISNALFRSNWDLSAARAIAVVLYLGSRGVPLTRLAATGFGEFQPLDPADTNEARGRNRRIEFKLTER